MAEGTIPIALKPSCYEQVLTDLRLDQSAFSTNLSLRGFTSHVLLFYVQNKQCQLCCTDHKVSKNFSKDKLTKQFSRQLNGKSSKWNLVSIQLFTTDWSKHIVMYFHQSTIVTIFAQELLVVASLPMKKITSHGSQGLRNIKCHNYEATIYVQQAIPGSLTTSAIKFNSFSSSNI